MKLHLPTRGFLVLLMMCLACTQIWAQSRKVSGTIIDNETKKPLTGVTVGIKGSDRSVLTDADGKFEISVPSDQTVLKFTYVGFGYVESTVGKKIVFNISLIKSNQNLDDVVVVGYGTQKARNVTGSVVTVDTKKMEDLPVSSLSEMLRGQVAGVSVTGGSTRPGTLASVTVRQQFYFGKDGGTTLPLVIIDDVEQVDPSNNNLSTLATFNALDLSEVESITVLRDAQAAIYGPRASQGVIIVKTKRGKAGAPKISYASKFEIGDAVSHSKTMTAQQYGIWNNRFFDALQPGTPNNFFTPTEIDSMANINYDWLSSWKAAGNMQHSLNVSGGSDRATYFVGGSYYTQGANLGAQDFNRWTFRSGADVKVAAGLKLSATISANSTSIEKSFSKISLNDAYAGGSGQEQVDYAVLLHMPKYIPWQYNINGAMQYISPVLKPSTIGAITTSNTLPTWNYYALLNNGSQTNPNTFNYNANFQLQYDIPFIKGLSVKGTYSIGSTASNTEQDYFAQTLFQATNASVAGTHLFNANTIWNQVSVTSGTRVTYGNTTSTIQQTDFYLNYDRSFGSHNISAVFVGEQSKSTYNASTLLYNTPVPGGYVGTFTTAGTLDQANSSTAKNVFGTQSYLGRVNYNYKNKYLAQVMFRSDAANQLAPQNYWGVFPGASVGWVISEEGFFKRNVRWVDNLKIRFSIGETGSANIKAFKWEQLYTPSVNAGLGFGSNGGLLTNGLTPGVSPNPNINWDKTWQHNLGLDMAFLHNRLVVNLDGYYNTLRDQITTAANALNVPITVGGSYAEQNYTGVNAWGGEVNIAWHDHVGKVDYTIGINSGFSNNTTVKYYAQPFNYPAGYAGLGSLLQGGSSIQPTYGYNVWRGTSTGDGLLRTDADIANYWNYLTGLATKAGTTPLYNAGGANISSAAGMKKGMLAYQDQAGNLNTTTQTIADQDGRINDQQDWVKLAKSGQTYGFVTNLGVSFQGISFLTQIATSWGGYRSIDRISQATSSSSAQYSQVAYLNDMYDTANNVNGKYPNEAYYSSAYVASDFWTLPTFRCNIRSMSIGYGLPKQWMDKIHIQNAKIVLSGYNLWDLYNPYPGKYRNMYDGPTVTYPTLRTWALGINLGF